MSKQRILVECPIHKKDMYRVSTGKEIKSHVSISNGNNLIQEVYKVVTFEGECGCSFKYKSLWIQRHCKITETIENDQ